MNKPTLLYVSPFWPMRSGISEYSESLVPGMDAFFDVTILVNNYQLTNKDIKKMYKVSQYSRHADYSKYDYIIYNFGNNPDFHGFMYEMLEKFPGYVILHDFILYYLTVGYYDQKGILYQKLYEIAGVDGIQAVKRSLKENPARNLLEHKALSAKLPLNREVLQKAKGIFVHSEFSRDLVNSCVENQNVYVIPIVKTAFTAEQTGTQKGDYLLKKFDIPRDAFVIGSAGLIAPTKQNELVCKAVVRYNATHEDKVYYVMVGDGGYVDSYLDEYIKKTGFVENDEFFRAIQNCDLIMNLRYPYNGEASYTLMQCMELRKPCVVTNIGWFGELPEHCTEVVEKDVTVDEMVQIIEKYIQSSDEEMIENAYCYVTEDCAPGAICEKIYRFVTAE